MVRAPYEQDVAQVARNLSDIGARLDQSQRGEMLGDDLKRRVARLRSLPAFDGVAAYVTPGGVTAGQGTTVEAVLSLAGFRTLGADARNRKNCFLGSGAREKGSIFYFFRFFTHNALIYYTN